MALRDAEVERFARQIIIPGIGARGQERLLASRVVVLGDGAGAEAALLYARAAGLQVTADRSRADCAIVDAASTPARILEDLAGGALPVAWFLLLPDAALSGLHPEAALPRRAGGEPREPAAADAARLAAVTAAACDAVAMACALLTGLPLEPGPHRVPLA